MTIYTLPETPKNFHKTENHPMVTVGKYVWTSALDLLQILQLCLFTNISNRDSGQITDVLYDYI